MVGGDLFCRDQEEEVMAMAKVFCKTPSKSGGKVGKWERCPLKDCISPEPVVKSKTPGRPVRDDDPLCLSLTDSLVICWCRSCFPFSLVVAYSETGAIQVIMIMTSS